MPATANEKSYPYTDAEMDRVYNTLAKTLFSETRDAKADLQPEPKILLVAGVQGSGKTYMLDNHLIPTGRYDNYIRLYSDSFRTLHPRYEAMSGLSVTERYKHTEGFIWRLGDRIFQEATKGNYNIIMESALDTHLFASTISGRKLAGYQFEVHVIGCKKDFVHLSTIKRALDSLDNGTLERFVDIVTIETSIENAEAILNACESACMRVSGSQISIYERGFGALKNRVQLCHSICIRKATLTPHTFSGVDGRQITVEEQTHQVVRSDLLPAPCSFLTFDALVNAPIEGAEDRHEAWSAAYKAIERMRNHWGQIPQREPEAAWSYIKKYSV
jgi:hypothetical protein